MKKYIRIILSIVVILMLVGCGKKEKHEIEILIPDGCYLLIFHRNLWCLMKNGV